MKYAYALIVLLLTACTTTGNVVDTTEPIEIGSILILTGDGAAWGNAAKNGMDLAIADVNAAGGVNGRPLIAKHQDDHGKPADAVTAFNYLVDQQNIHLIIGTSWSAVGMPLVPLANEKNVLMISPSLGKKEFNEEGKYLFNTWPHDFILSAQLADVVYNAGHRRIALIGAEDIWVNEQTDAFTKRFTALGGTIVVTVEPLPSDQDPYAEALKIAHAKDIDAVVSTTDGVAVGARVAKRMRDLGVFAPMYSVTIDQNTIDAAQGAYEGLTYLTFLNPTEEFTTHYTETFGIAPDIGSSSAYDAVMLLADAMKATGSTDPAELTAYIESVKQYSGASGALKSDGKHGYTKESTMYIVKNGVAQ
jgi:branched-chain amino acid transport system substrate-binding protein